jgi:DNA-binding NarL/FixJ family response regulator
MPKRTARQHLTDQEALIVVNLRHQGLLLKEIAHRFNSSVESICRVTRGLTHTSITGIKYQPWSLKLIPADYHRIRELRAQGCTLKELAHSYNVCIRSIQNAINRATAHGGGK